MQVNRHRRKSTAVFLSALICMTFGGIHECNRATAGDAPAYKEFSGTFPDGTPWLIRVPNDWNGTLINDLDYLPKSTKPLGEYFLSKGFAAAGTGRHPKRRYIFDPAQQSRNLIAVLDKFEELVGKPKTTIQWGTSSGGNDALVIAETEAGRVDGAISECPSIPVLTSGQRFDLFFVLKELLAPGRDDIVFAALPDDSASAVSGWNGLLADAIKSDVGLARISLALAMTQWPAHTTPSIAWPDDNDQTALTETLKKTITALPKILPGQFMYERQGALVGNSGADYQAYFRNADPAARRLTEALYAKAGLDLEQDVRRVQSSHRIPAGQEAQTHWFDDPARTPRGDLGVPVFRMHTIGDELIIAAQNQSYDELVGNSAKLDLLRSAFVARAEHCNFSLAEDAAALDVLLERIRTGKWPATTAIDLNLRASKLVPSAEAAFAAGKLRDFNGNWRLEQRDWYISAKGLARP